MFCSGTKGRIAPELHQTLKFKLSQVERALQEEKGDKIAAALRLGISKSSLYAKIEQYGIALIANSAPR